MRIKRKSFGMKYVCAAALIGIAVCGISILGFVRLYEKQAEERMLKTANYMKVQCATYTHYNYGAETQALLRAVESNNQVRDNLKCDTEINVEINEELLKRYAKDLWLQGILVLDQDGSVVCGYAEDTEVETLLLQNYSRGTVLGGEGYAFRSYTQRIYLDTGGYINMAATSRTDAPGMVVTYYYIAPECAQTYSLTLQSLLEGYQTATDGTIMIADEGQIIACNNEELIGQNTEDNVTVQALKAAADSNRMVHIPKLHSCGVMVKQRDYYIYTYTPNAIVYSGLGQNVIMILVLYAFVAAFVWVMLGNSDRKHRREELVHETEYRKGLEEAAKKADEANAAKTQFLQRMSHDIRTPINGICGMLQVAEFYADDLDKQAECRAKIKDASHLLLELVNEVLDMGKLESGEIVLEEQPFDLREVVEEVCVVIEKLASEQGITLIRENCGVTHRYLIGSVSHVKRLFMNIMSNAVKYNKTGGTITIRCRELPATEENIALMEFVCEDTGIGMSEEYQKKIFEPFTQENEDVQTKYGGSGLGMSIAKGLVDKMNGTITFESEEGKGSVFVVTIPFRVDTGRNAKTAEEQQKTFQYSVKGCKVLLVEDNELNMEISEFVLKTEGVVVTKAWNGQEAVELFTSTEPGTFDAIIMDVMMPVMDGYAATVAIRSMDREDAKTIPIIAMTANAFTEDRIRAREAGMSAHVSKPLDASVLIEILHNLTAASPMVQRQHMQEQKKSYNAGDSHE